MFDATPIKPIPHEPRVFDHAESRRHGIFILRRRRPEKRRLVGKPDFEFIVQVIASQIRPLIETASFGLGRPSIVGRQIPERVGHSLALNS